MNKSSLMFCKNAMRPLTFAVALVAFAFTVFGQGNVSVTKPSANPIPATPNAAAFQKYGDVPVSLNTGIPSISIPIANIELKEFSWPISLSYHAGGFKSDDVASNAGLGWVLNAGGVITSKQSSINGGVKIDELRNLDLRTGVTMDQECQYINPVDMDIAERMSTGERVQSPDFYQLNAGSLSYRFIHSNSLGRTLPYSDLKITSSGFNLNAPLSWTVLDTDGNRFEFNLRGYNYRGSDCLNSTPTTTINPVYYLTRVVTKMGETLDFFYDDEVYSYRTPDLISTKTIDPAQPSGYCNCPQTETITCQNNLTAFEKRLNRIESSRGDVIRFLYGDRLDLPGSSSLKVVRRLFKNTLGAERLLAETVLQQTYFGTGSDSYGLQLRLDAVTSFGQDQVSAPMEHRFEYVAGPLPHKLSQSIVFNGGTLYSPLATYNISTAGLLNKLSYPSGGFTTFLYEALPGLGQARVLEIKNFSSAGEMSGFRKFQYHDPVSTHITLPFTENESSFFWGNPANGGPLSTVNEGNYCSYLPSLSELILECKRVVRKSTPIQSTVKELSEAGNFFKHITELFGGNGENGKIEYTYGNGIVAGVRTHNDIGYLTNKDDKLVSKKVFARLSNGNFDLKSEELLEYGVPDDTDPNFYAGTTNSGKETRFWIKKVQKVRDDMQLACPSAGHYCFHKVFFETNARIAAVPLELRKRTLKQFENGQLQEDITHFFYESNLHGFATRVQTTNSKNEVIEKYLKFPPDVSGNSVFQSMSTKNQIGTPVEERLVRQIGNRELNKTELVYAGYNNGTHFLPSQVRTSVAGAPLETELSFEQYDAAGNLLQARDKAGIVTSYVWAYGNRLPAAKVVGATHSSLQSYVNTNSYGNIHDPAAIETGLAPLRNMPGAQASIYSYQPGVGMLATIDPRGVRSTYEYDGSGRLIAVRDHTGNIVRQMCYNYANQPVECTDLVTFTSLAAAFKNNTAYSGSFTRSCGAGANGSSVNYTVPVGSVVSYISQADANTKAQQKLQVLGQAYANIHGSCSTLPPTIYAVLSIENVSVGGTSTFGDVVLRFYADAAHTVPVSVTGLAVRIREQFHDNMNSTVNDAEFTVQANGSVFVALAGVELSSNDGWTTDWYKTFTLLTNPGYNF